jgi:hypothetical protein
MDAATLQGAEVWRAAAAGDVHQKWQRISGLLQGWPLLTSVPPTEWFTILARLRSILVLDQMASRGKPVATASREGAAALLKHIVAGALESTSPAIDGVEVYRQKVTKLLTSERAGGSVLDILLALFTVPLPPPFSLLRIEKIDRVDRTARRSGGGSGQRRAGSGARRPSRRPR